MNKLINDNALKVLDEMKERGETVDCIITDPPYKLTSRGSSGTMGGEFWTSERAKRGELFVGIPDISDWIEKCYDVLKDGTHIYIMTNDKNITHYLDVIKDSSFKFVKTLTWVKPNKITGRWYMTQKETIILARKGKARPINNAGTPDVLMTPDFKKIKQVVDGKTINIHDTEKPVSLMETLINNSTNNGETVLDPFMGAGSTGVASAKNGRKFVGIELDETYFNIAKERIENAN